MFVSSIIRDSINEYCERHHLSWRQFAAIAGTKEEPFLQMMEGESVPDLGTVERMAVRAMRWQLTKMLEKGA